MMEPMGIIALAQGEIEHLKDESLEECVSGEQNY
jgi:hypothetical protein